MAREAHAIMKKPHPLVSRGQIVRGDDGEPLLDYRPVLRAIDRLLDICERKAKLLGLDVPPRRQETTIEQLEAEIAELTAKLGIQDGAR
jgi:hypothetical protein